MYVCMYVIYVGMCVGMQVCKGIQVCRYTMWVYLQVCVYIIYVFQYLLMYKSSDTCFGYSYRRNGTSNMQASHWPSHKFQIVRVVEGADDFMWQQHMVVNESRGLSMSICVFSLHLDPQDGSIEARLDDASRFQYNL